MTKKGMICVLLAIAPMLTPPCRAARDVPCDEQYILLMTPAPLTIEEAGFREIISHFEGASRSRVKVGLAFIFPYLRDDVNRLAEAMERILFYAQKTQTPIMIKLDGENWWQGRPDLWNWWDPDMPGYDPNNRDNVEWRWWGPEYALKIAWRNWGRQGRVLPPPNLMSPAYRRACHEAMDVLMPVLLDWYKALPDDEKYLFVGLNLGWESAIGINAFYYPNGEERMDKPRSDDPLSGTVNTDVLGRGVVQQGYAAVKTAGIRTGGDITEEDLYAVVHRHMEDLCKYAFDFGFPRDKIITHGWGNAKGERMYDAAVNPYSCPGWSVYWHALDVGKDTGIMRNVQKSDAPYWAVAEWMLPKPHDKETWKTAIANTLGQPGCKLMCMYGWKGISQSPPAIEAIRQVSLEHIPASQKQQNDKDIAND